MSLIIENLDKKTEEARNPVDQGGFLNNYFSFAQGIYYSENRDKLGK